MSTRASEAGYAALREQLEQILSEGQVLSKRAGQWQKVETYWHLGDAIYAHLQGRKDRAPYGEQLIARLAADLALGEVTVHETVRFRRAFPILYTCKELAWSHYRVLSRLPSEQRRRFYEKAANEGRWSLERLTAQVQADVFGQTVKAPLAVPEDEDPLAGPPLVPRFGPLHTYRLVAGVGGAPALDLGFHLRWDRPLPGVRSPKAGMVVTAARAAGDYRFRAQGEPPPLLWTCGARVVRVIDGDTLEAEVDCGFRLRTPQRLRLRGVDAPEVYRRAGRRARDFVRQALPEGAAIVVATSKTDQYGRYLADVAYLPEKAPVEEIRERGTYLNRQLLAERLARRYEG